jgi:hypothetical protein
MLATTHAPFRAPTKTEIQLNALHERLYALRIEIAHREQMYNQAIEHLQCMITAVEMHHRMDLLETRMPCQ